MTTTKVVESSLFLRDFLDEFHFFRVEWLAVLPKDVVEPHWRFGREGFGSGARRIDRLCSAGHQSPVVSANPLLFQVSQDRIECAASRPGHVFCAQDRPLVTTEVFHVLLHVVQLAVTMEGNDVGLLQCKSVKWSEVVSL